MKHLSQVVSDFVGLVRVCGAPVAIRWLFAIVANVVAIIERRDLQPADRALGDGPFRVRLTRYGVAFRIVGAGAISGIREMYVRDTYLHHGLIRISDGDTILDLGANLGNFTNLALSFGKNVRVVAVEPHIGANSRLLRSVGLNSGYLQRVTLIPAFLGLMSQRQEQMKSSDANYSRTRWITEEQLIEEGNLTKVDVLKCDIEGGEFGLLHRESKLFRMVRSVAVEVHAFAGDVNRFMDDLEALGFSIVAVTPAPGGSATVLAKRL